MLRKKLPKDFKARKKLEKCLIEDGWASFDIDILLGYSVKLPSILNSFQSMIYQDDKLRLRMVNFYLEKYDIRAEM